MEEWEISKPKENDTAQSLLSKCSGDSREQSRVSSNLDVLYKNVLEETIIDTEK